MHPPCPSRSPRGALVLGTVVLAALARLVPRWRGGMRDRRGAVALMVGVMTPAMLGFLGLTVDAGFWMVGQTRLQVAADAGAMGASFLLTSANFKAMTATTRQSTAQAVALAEAQGAMTKMMGTLVTPATVSVASDYSSVTVTLYSQATSYFPGIFGIAAPLMRATATASVPTVGNCVLALATSGNALMVDNGGTIATTACTVASYANIYLNSGVIATCPAKSGCTPKIMAAGAVSLSNSGSNTMSPTGTSNSAVPADPYSGRTPPTASATCSTQTFTAYSSTQYVATPGTWCKGLAVGGNSSTIKFTAGVYIITGGDLNFANASVTADPGVSFVILGGYNFYWQNNSSSSTTITAPTTGATAGLVIWQVCNSGTTGQTATFKAGGTMNFGSAIYLPCSAADIGDSTTITGPSGGPLSFIAKTIYVHGSGQLQPTGGGSVAAAAVLTQ